MQPKYLLDTDVFSLMVKGQDEVINTRLQTLAKGDAVLSVITTGEYFYGVTHAPVSALREKRAKRLIDFFGVLPMEADVGAIYGAIRADLRAKGTPIGPNDLWLAAHAKAHGLTMVTRNTREFKRVKGLKVEDWL
ncbi:type II toxin-antitoxin system VapC family toxin [Rhodoferax sp. AJA081-3]|uniref:type II toxin-antitoxin system VapC family toxin n=1 Tax=Rhodoferax sp. AJA081-3 TaxID=2752316 RepID=UPI001AE0A29A|nr:type II toxin-antitoxin system VapC family toxin [Rhodoferax sp. AJA081-3]QTN27442.1 type II toxin-antitoxin system VapC family toxin [Rhodoferax sp. AJA081-3]